MTAELRPLVHRAVFDMWTTGYSDTAMAAALGVTRNVIGLALRKHAAFWREYAGQAIDQHLGEQLARLDKAEREAWAAWERSKYPEEKTRREIANKGGATFPGKDGKPDRTVSGRKDDRTVVDARGRDGDPRYMALIVRIQQTRAALIARMMPEPESGGGRMPMAGRGEAIYPDELWGDRNSLPQTTPLLEAYLSDPSSLPNDGSGVPKPPDIDDPAYMTPPAPIAAVIDLKRRKGEENGASTLQDDDEVDDGSDDDEFGF